MCSITSVYANKLYFCIKFICPSIWMIFICGDKINEEIHYECNLVLNLTLDVFIGFLASFAHIRNSHAHSHLYKLEYKVQNIGIMLNRFYLNDGLQSLWTLLADIFIHLICICIRFTSKLYEHSYICVHIIVPYICIFIDFLDDTHRLRLGRGIVAIANICRYCNCRQSLGFIIIYLFKLIEMNMRGMLRQCSVSCETWHKRATESSRDKRWVCCNFVFTVTTYGRQERWNEWKKNRVRVPFVCVCLRACMCYALLSNEEVDRCVRKDRK